MKKNLKKVRIYERVHIDQNSDLITDFVFHIELCYVGLKTIIDLNRVLPVVLIICGVKL